VCEEKNSVMAIGAQWLKEARYGETLNDWISYSEALALCRITFMMNAAGYSALYALK
jgi:hypothetical protein